MIKEGRVPIFSNTNQHGSEAETAYHISVERMNYPVPFEYINQKVDIRLTRATVGVFYGGNRICSLLRLYGRPI